jgi:hypothetical protein
VVTLINRHFVPVYLSNEDLRDGTLPPEERKEVQRINHETLKAKRSAGTVHVYILTPDGVAFDSMHVAEATKVDKLTAMLENDIERLKAPAGEPLVAAKPQSTAPKPGPGELVLHIVARNVVKQGNDLVPTRAKLGETRSGNWGAYPGEDWVTLSAKEVAKLLPTGDAASWEIDAGVAERFLTYFYPSTENNDVLKHKFEQLQLNATRVSAKDGVTRARLEGKLAMKHNFYHKEDGNSVTATLTGYLDFDAKQVRTLRIVTDEASYAKRPFGVALRSVP